MDVGPSVVDLCRFRACGAWVLDRTFSKVDIAPGKDSPHRTPEDKMRFKDFAREFSIGCTTHFLLAIAAAILLGGAVHYWGFSGRTLFATVAVVLFVIAVFFPWKRRMRE